MIDLSKIPNIVLFDMFRAGKEYNFCHFLGQLEKTLEEKQEIFDKTVEKMNED